VAATDSRPVERGWVRRDMTAGTARLGVRSGAWRVRA
jgi:hypothetical protein